MQSDRRPRRFIDFRQGLLAGVALAAWAPLASSALAQAQPAAEVRTPAPAADGLPEGAVYVDAASATRQGDVVTAVGTPDQRVYLRTRGYVLRGESLSYDLLAGTAAADGRVEAVAPDGTVVYASHLELDKDLKTGVAVDFATRLNNGASLMAATAVRRTETVSELNYALFTPCPICDEKGPRRPTISIQAEKVVQDEQLRAVLYRNAVFYVGPVPVFYTP